jgi:hypothetical protein
VKIGNGGFLLLRRDQTGRVENGGLGVWSLVVGVQDEGLSAETSIWLGPQGVETSLGDFFADLARDSRGWPGVKEWEGMEGGLTLSCTHEGGHVIVAVSLKQLSGAGWETRVDVTVDPGQLDVVAMEIRELLTL